MFEYKRSLTTLLLVLGCLTVSAQQTEPVAESEFKEPLTAFWINTYGNIRLSDRFFWVAQTHFRFQESARLPLAGQIGQIYNRHAISYLYSKYFRVSLGGVMRFNFNQDEVPEGERRTVPEYRIWHEYLFAQHLSRLMLYHRIRLEHRWTRGFTDTEADDWIFRNRWRYMISMKIPLNKPKLSPGAFYVGPEAELIMQSGKAVVDSPLEDLRLHTSFGYIVNPRLTFATGLMYSMGQDLAKGAYYKQKWTWRVHMYFSPDFRKVKNKLPMIHLTE
ncbi:uncharacterized protein DUF2490 [Neolewinella xylanilytica]|uniref:Uncharacterized protein DUF2490 n=1 Tax=Neolewinella xylanilytica TaxID=1514080 RepID=A0A2S6I8C3_9BACT|nr:DUF2490 domain-containing protein [Neolewinella xylanilytica]PPK87729.1 uncharacterized protein DUF2490 [Neolewinella xylanilytica]